MATFVTNKPLSADLTDITANGLDLNAGPHDFIFTNHRQVILVENGEAVPLTINLHGADVGIITCEGVGTEDLTAGKDLVIAVGATATIYLKAIHRYLGASG